MRDLEQTISMRDLEQTIIKYNLFYLFKLGPKFVAWIANIHTIKNLIIWLLIIMTIRKYTDIERNFSRQALQKRLKEVKGLNKNRK